MISRLSHTFYRLIGAKDISYRQKRRNEKLEKIEEDYPRTVEEKIPVDWRKVKVILPEGETKTYEGKFEKGEFEYEIHSIENVSAYFDGFTGNLETKVNTDIESHINRGKYAIMEIINNYDAVINVEIILGGYLKEDNLEIVEKVEDVNWEVVKNDE